ncbi:MAG: type II toxin-antitoxin system RelE/ParE family toxin [Rhabdochlamydiaceae bacterium]
MIISFADQGTEDIYNGVSSKRARNKLNPVLWEKAQTKLDMINRAHRLDDLKIPPNNKLEKLERDLAGKHSIRINDQYRIIFKWDSDTRGALEVKITDYH